MKLNLDELNASLKEAHQRRVFGTPAQIAEEGSRLRMWRDLIVALGRSLDARVSWSELIAEVRELAKAPDTLLGGHWHDQ